MTALAGLTMADRAYKRALRLVGESTALLNNQGYSYMLRGKHGRGPAQIPQSL